MKLNQFIQKIHHYSSFGILFVQLLSLLACLLLLIQGASFGAIVIVVFMTMLFLQPLLSMIYFGSINKQEHNSNNLFYKKWLNANSVGTVGYLVLSIIVSIISLVDFEKIQDSLLQIIEGSPLSESVIKIVFYCFLSYNILFLTHCVYTLMRIRKGESPSMP